MKCLLFLLASGLVTSDKLDRTYLPPLGAKYSGGTLDDLHPPLEFPKETYMGIIQNGPLVGFHPDNTFPGISTYQNIGKGMSTVPIDYSTSTLPHDLIQTTSYPKKKYGSTVTTSRPVSGLYDDFPPKSPSSGYLPSKQLNAGTQYTDDNPRPRFESISTINGYGPGVDQKDKGNYYYVPKMQSHINGIANQRYYKDGSPIAGLVQFPDKINNGYILDKGQYFIPRTGTTDDIIKNYQPGSFGYYGGNPMIMTSQNALPQEIGNMELTSKFGENENKLLASLESQGRLQNSKITSKMPFQTPFVPLNSKNAFTASNLKTSTNAPDTIQPQFPTTTTKSFSNKSLPAELDQINGIPVPPRSRSRQRRPQAELERSAVIINYENSISPEGYSYSYDTSNGIHADESGTANNGVRAKGSYSYTGDDGKIYTVVYTADENGFRPRGDHLPTPPPIPEAIKKIVDQAAKDKAAGIIDDGFYDEKKYGHMNYQGAMEHYNPYKNNIHKVSRLNGTKGKPNKSSQTLNNNKFYNMPLYNTNVPKTNEKITGSSNSLQNIRSHNADETYSKENKLIENGLNSGTRTISKEITQNKEQFGDQKRRPITSVTNNQITNGVEEIYSTENPIVKNKPTNVNVGISNTDDKISRNETPDTNSEVTFNDEGYYYVPPIIKFNPSTEKPAFKKNSSITTNEPTLENTDTETNKRTDFGGAQIRKNIDEEAISTQLPFNVNTDSTKPSRKPYVSGPNEQQNLNYYNTQSTASDENNISSTYPNYLDKSLYGLNTTPKTAHKIPQLPDDEYLNQYYQSTTMPTIFDQTIPGAVENRVNIPQSNNGITVSQDFVTTTYRPSISGDGVLEVNQNVKIYGVGRPEATTVDNGYPNKVPMYSYNKFYSMTPPDGESTIPGVYPNSFYTGQDKTLFQAVPEQSAGYGNQYLTTRVPELDSGIITSPYLNSGFNGQPQGEAVTLPDFSSNTFGNFELTTQQELPIPIIPTENQGPGGRIIGEDFSGPRQSQKFDPETGYYYK